MIFENTDDEAIAYSRRFEASCIMLTFELGFEGWVTAGQADKGGKDILGWTAWVVPLSKS